MNKIKRSTKRKINRSNIPRFRVIYPPLGDIAITTAMWTRENQSIAIRKGPKEVNGILARRSRVTLGT